MARGSGLRRLLVASLALGALSFSSWGLDVGSQAFSRVGNVAFAQEPAAAAPSSENDVVVARVGSTTITAAELERRLSQTPRAVLRGYGSSPEEIRRNFLEHVLVREALFAEEAASRKLDGLRDVRDRTLGVLRYRVLADVRAQLKADQISDAEVQAFFTANSKQFSSPLRVGIYRILVESEADARAILNELGETPDLKKWNDLASNKSLDPETNKRGGDLGFVAEDGSTDHAHGVDPELFRAAQKVKDGELVREPVKEGDKFAVVWKRETRKPGSRGLEAETPRIRAAIADERTREAVKKLLEELRATEIKELNPELCDMVVVNAVGELERAKRPGVLPRAKRAAQPIPIEGSPGGLR